MLIWCMQCGRRALGARPGGGRARAGAARAAPRAARAPAAAASARARRLHALGAAPAHTYVV